LAGKRPAGSFGLIPKLSGSERFSRTSTTVVVGMTTVTVSVPVVKVVVAVEVTVVDVTYTVLLLSAQY
jgi:hypothetical protein